MTLRTTHAQYFSRGRVLSARYRRGFLSGGCFAEQLYRKTTVRCCKRLPQDGEVENSEWSRACSVFSSGKRRPGEGVEIDFLGLRPLFPGNGRVVDPALTATPWSKRPASNSQKSCHKTSSSLKCLHYRAQECFAELDSYPESAIPKDHSL